MQGGRSPDSACSVRRKGRWIGSTARQGDLHDVERRVYYFRPEWVGERRSKRRIVLLEPRQMKQSLLIGGSLGYSSHVRRGGGVNMKRMGGMCGRLGERWRWVRPADIMARESSVERHDVGILVR